MKELLTLRNVTKKFGDKIANDSINLVIGKGERVGIIGANGAGKTTLVEQIIGLSNPTSGSVEYGFNYKRTPQEGMGIQFQESSYPPGITVKDIIEFNLSIYGGSVDIEYVKDIIKVFQMDKFITAKAKSLSGGQQQKLNVLLAVIHKPELIILDEISTGLDILAREEIISYVEKILKDESKTSILISHHMSEIERLCDRVIVLKDGKIFADESIDQVKQKHGTLDQYMREVISNEII